MKMWLFKSLITFNCFYSALRGEYKLSLVNIGLSLTGLLLFSLSHISLFIPSCSPFFSDSISLCLLTISLKEANVHNLQPHQWLRMNRQPRPGSVIANFNAHVRLYVYMTLDIYLTTACIYFLICFLNWLWTSSKQCLQIILFSNNQCLVWCIIKPSLINIYSEREVDRCCQLKIK
jgi:hypothetical protein